MSITEQYATLIWHAYFQSANLLDKIKNTKPKSFEREMYEAELNALKECLKEHITKTQTEIVNALRQNKAEQLVKDLLNGR
jgi:hypothetical protein